MVPRVLLKYDWGEKNEVFVGRFSHVYTKRRQKRQLCEIITQLLTWSGDEFPLQLFLLLKRLFFHSEAPRTLTHCRRSSWKTFQHSNFPPSSRDARSKVVTMDFVCLSRVRVSPAFKN